MDGCTNGPQLEEGEKLNTRALGTGRTPSGGTSAPAGQAQGGTSPAFVKENIDVLRIMIMDLDNRGLRKKKQEGTLLMGPLGQGAEERVKAFIRGETSIDTTESIRSPRCEKSVSKANWLEGQNEKEGFTPLTKTPKEILALDNVNFPPPPPMVGTPKKRNMNKFCDYHQDRGHNTNDCYHLKNQIEEAVASGRLAHLVKNIRQGGQKSKGSAKGKEKVINMLMNCPMVVEAMIEGFKVRRIHVDGGSSSEESAGKTRTSNGIAEVKSPFPCILPSTRRDIDEELRSCASLSTQMIGFPTSTTSSEVINPRVLLAPVETRPWRQRKEPMQLDDMEEKRQLDKGRKPPKFGVKEKIVVNDNYPEQLVTIGGGLSAECRHALIHTLRKNVNIFAWTPADMTGIPRAITEHSLDTYPHIDPKTQKKRSLAPDRRKVVTDEVNEWLKADIVRRVRYLTWVANSVLVKKVDGS
ncbi:hypothetical protein Tco_0679903 [Tanacetum coccineum]|uniref:Reverse transcriptase domain-containing protein n=1 Tax=Tanacetum coccineum TaxID=301880 RepID=A0ABQ4XJD8_9ASTR